MISSEEIAALNLTKFRKVQTELGKLIIIQNILIDFFLQNNQLNVLI